ncbi:proline-rich receptor-like protein kinase PERK2 [Ipomoea triloba]|uniref:proline-rich receptor-like protein kinase PERK2 n=1 Tax=Ipomoea triloba TaxID=35885 RepID=UPI00125DCA0C|nr:proline-rich receptor-like protein kinase PERK2 [Ipomoea triloba]
MDSKIIFFSITLLFTSGAAINITTVTFPLVNRNSANTNSVLDATSPAVPVPSSSSSPTNSPPATPTPTNAPPTTPTSAPPSPPSPPSPNSAAPTSPTNPPQPAGPITPAAPSPRKILSPPLPPNIVTPAASPAPTTDDDSSVGRSLEVSAGIIVAANLFLMLMA